MPRVIRKDSRHLWIWLDRVSTTQQVGREAGCEDGAQEIKLEQLSGPPPDYGCIRPPMANEQPAAPVIVVIQAGPQMRVIMSSPSIGLTARGTPEPTGKIRPARVELPSDWS